MTIMTIVLLVLSLFAAGEDSLATARELYASAAYEDALAVLGRLPQASLPAGDARIVEQYRALCLLALGRAGEAQTAMEAVVAGDPGYRPAADVSPRVRIAFSDVRRRMLPAIIQQRYAHAKGAFDRKDFQIAGGEFTQLLEAMNDPDVEAVASQPPLSDLRILAAGFRDLSVMNATPPPPLPVAASPAPLPSLPPALEPGPRAPRVYTAADPNVVPPIIIRQDLPSFPGRLVAERVGVLEVTVGETGTVESVTLRQSVSPQYDSLAVTAARAWRYQPATVNGMAVKYKKAVQVSLKAEAPRR